MSPLRLLHEVFVLCCFVALIVGTLPSYAAGDEWLLEPTGLHQIGTATYHWIDEGRDEVLTEDPGDKRHVLAQIWYPAEVGADAVAATYLPRGAQDAPYLSTIGDLELSISLEEFASTPTHSYWDVPVSDELSSYPVLLYSPGLPGKPELATGQIEELASHGYIVVGINHPYISLWSVYPDGQVITPVNWLEMNSGEFDQSMVIGVQDQSFILDQLALLNDPASGDRLSGYLDLNHVGVFGVDWGSWVAAAHAVNDTRVKAVLVEGTHSYMMPDTIRKDFFAPIMIMDSLGENSSVAFQRMDGPTYQVRMPELAWYNFTDFMLWPGIFESLPSWETGKVEPARAARVIMDYELAFFDCYLKGEDSPLLHGESDDYPEVEFKSRNN